MSIVKKEKNSKRNYDDEADLQIKILEQKSREEYLTLITQSDNSTSNFGDANQMERRPETEAKVCISSNAKAILEKWMYEHRLYCYPTKFEKQALSIETGLSVQKISNWFINSRRRTLPKMLDLEGKSVDNFTISRKKKNAPMVTDSATFSKPKVITSLTDYANQEESKIIDQSSIFYGDDIKCEIQQNDPYYDSVLQEIVVPFVEPFPEDSQSSYQARTQQQREKAAAAAEKVKSKWLHQPIDKAQQQSGAKLPSTSPLYVSRGILYDESTQSKCIYIVIN